MSSCQAVTHLLSRSGASTRDNNNASRGTVDNNIIILDSNIVNMGALGGVEVA